LISLSKWIANADQADSFWSITSKSSVPKVHYLKFAINLFVESYFNASDATKAKKLSAPDGVVRTYLTAKSIDGHDGDAVRIGVDQGQRRQLEFPVQPHQESTSSHVRIAFALITSATVRN
jgi:hypothetical protein